MDIFTGAMLALIVGVFATLAGFDRERGFYAVVAIVVATYYVLFAAIGGSARAMSMELAAMAVFFVLAVAGFRTNRWLIVAALFAHGMFDAVHGHLIDNAGVPAWWPGFCMAYDVVAAAYLAGLLIIERRAGRND